MTHPVSAIRQAAGGPVAAATGSTAVVGASIFCLLWRPAGGSAFDLPDDPLDSEPASCRDAAAVGPFQPEHEAPCPLGLAVVSDGKNGAGGCVVANDPGARIQLPRDDVQVAVR